MILKFLLLLNLLYFFRLSQQFLRNSLNSHHTSKQFPNIDRILPHELNHANPKVPNDFTSMSIKRENCFKIHTRANLKDQRDDNKRHSMLGIDWEKAIHLLTDIKGASGVDPSLIVHNAAISACEKVGDGQKALKIYHSLIESQLLPDKITFTNTMSACEKACMSTEVRKLFQDMLEINIHPNLEIYLIVLSTSAQDGDSDLAVRTLESMKKDELLTLIPAQAYWNVIFACEKAGNKFTAIECFNELKRKKSPIPLAIFNSLLAIYNMYGEWQAALKLFYENFEFFQIKPNLQTLNSLFHALVENDQINEMEKLWSFIKENHPDLTPSPYTYQICIKGFAKSLKLEKSMNLLNFAISSHGKKLSKLSYEYILEGCATQNNSKVALSVLQKKEVHCEGGATVEDYLTVVKILFNEKDWNTIISLNKEKNLSSFENEFLKTYLKDATLNFFKDEKIKLQK